MIERMRSAAARPGFTVASGTRRREWQGLLYVAPWVAGFLIFTAYPVV